MSLRRYTWIVFSLVLILLVSSSTPMQFRNDDYLYLDPDMEDVEEDLYGPGPDIVEADEDPNKFYFSPYPRSADSYVMDDSALASETTTECETEPPPAEARTITADVRTMPPAPSLTTPSPLAVTTPLAPAATTCITVLAGVTHRPLPSWTQTTTPAPTIAPSTQHHAPHTTAAPTTLRPSTTSTTPTTTSTERSTTLSSSTTRTSTSTSTSTSTESTTCDEEPDTTTIVVNTTTETTTKVLGAPETTTCMEEDTSTPKPTTLPYPYLRPVEVTTCMPVKNLPGRFNGSVNLQALGLQLPQLQIMQPSPLAQAEQDGKSRALHQLVQHLYVAQARVQLEAIEIKKAQAVANSAQQQLEEAANHVRSVTAALQNAQQEVASAAIRAQTAQLQLAAHDQLLFAARQDVDALSSQMVGLQAAEGISVPTVKFDIGTLLDKLKQPLPDAERPTAVPPVVAINGMPKPPAVYDDYDYY